MKIVAVHAFRYEIPFTHSLRTPLGAVHSAQNVAVRITSEDGLAGWGEASPLASITGDSPESCIETARNLAAALGGKDFQFLQSRIRDIHAVTVGESSIRGAFDVALHDLCAQAAGVPLYAFLGGERRTLRTDMTVSMFDSVADTAARALHWVTAGFNSLKLKVGRQGRRDVEHVAAVRGAVGPAIEL